MELKEALETRTYKPSRSVCFFATRPKLREIFAADFRDRIVHHILVDYLEEIWEPRFIHDSYACRRGKGVHQAVMRLRQFTRKVTKNGTYPAFFLQLDIKNYFMSIDKDILFSMIAPELNNDEALWLLRTLVYHDCTADYHFRGNVEILNKIPPHKSLFKVAKNKGLPIGNLNSQFFANVYLNLLDQFVKHQLKCRYYLRYCDDFLFLSRDREELTMWKGEIEAFLVNKLQLKIRKSYKLQPVSNGIDFLGYIVRPDYLLVRRRVVNNLQVKLREYKSLLVKEGRLYRRYLFDEEMLDRLHAVLSSYLGHFKMANSYNLCKSIWEKHTFLDQYFDFDPEACRLTRKYKYPAGIRRTCQQYFYYRWRFTGDVLLFQVGRFFEFYSEHDKEIACNIGLARIRKNRRGAKYGFPFHMFDIYIQRLFRHNTSMSVILESEQYPCGIKKRAPAYRLEGLTRH